jgi:hypothetical protein
MGCISLPSRRRRPNRLAQRRRPETLANAPVDTTPIGEVGGVDLVHGIVSKSAADVESQDACDERLGCVLPDGPVRTGCAVRRVVLCTIDRKIGPNEDLPTSRPAGSAPSDVVSGRSSFGPFGERGP